MSSKDPALCLNDVRSGIHAIEMFIAGMDLEAFRTDPKTVAAVERKLLVISEAAIRLGAEAELLCPGPPWRDVRGIGNWLRHSYDRIDLEQIWLTVSDDLPKLRVAVDKALADLGR